MDIFLLFAEHGHVWSLLLQLTSFHLKILSCDEMIDHCTTMMRLLSRCLFIIQVPALNKFPCNVFHVMSALTWNCKEICTSILDIGNSQCQQEAEDMIGPASGHPCFLQRERSHPVNILQKFCETYRIL